MHSSARSALEAAEAKLDPVSDDAAALTWALLPTDSPEEAGHFLALMRASTRRQVEHLAPSIATVARVLLDTHVLGGRAVADRVEGDRSKTKKPRSGMWTPLDTALVGGSHTPVWRGEQDRWDHPAVRSNPQMFVAADLSAEEVDAAAAAYRLAALESVAPQAADMDGRIASGTRIHIPGLHRQGECARRWPEMAPRPSTIPTSGRR